MSDAMDEVTSGEPLNLGDQSKADDAEAMQRLVAQGITPLTAAQAMAEMVRVFGTGEKTDVDMRDLVLKLNDMDEMELKQLLYVCSAAAHGAQLLGQAVMAVMAKHFFEKQLGAEGSLEDFYGGLSEEEGEEWKKGKPE